LLLSNRTVFSPSIYKRNLIDQKISNQKTPGQEILGQQILNQKILDQELLESTIPTSRKRGLSSSHGLLRLLKGQQQVTQRTGPIHGYRIALELDFSQP